VSHVEVALQSGMPLKVACDAVAMGYHLRPETQLADLAGCEFSFDDATRQWLPATDEDGRSSVKGVYLAGDGARIRGADAAERSGRLAALAAMQDSGLKVEGLAALREQLQVFSRFAAGLRAAFPWPARFASMLPDETIVCRCEAITAGELRRVVRETGAQEANRAKAFSRVGMGRCQGRFCAHASAEVIAAAASVPLASVGRLRGQAPVKPLPVALVEEEGATE
jgi:NADPH-dependent 2,4-dienoyl-CoA reductase/sulfur reductase-like enzyme